MRIPKHGFNDCDEGKWFSSWQDVTNEIGNKLKDSKWEEQYSLSHSKSGISIATVSDFANVFKNANNGQCVDFAVKVMFRVFPVVSNHFCLFFSFFQDN